MRLKNTFEKRRTAGMYTRTSVISTVEGTGGKGRRIGEQEGREGRGGGREGREGEGVEGE